MSLSGISGQSRVGAVIWVGQAQTRAECVLSIAFANMEYMLEVEFFCIDFACCFQSKTENKTAGPYLIDD